MPIDPRIALGIQPPQIQTPMELQSQAAQVANLQAQQGLNRQRSVLNDQAIQAGQQELAGNQLKIDAAKRRETGLSALSQLWAQNDGRPDVIVAGLTQAGYADLAQEFQENQAKIRKEVIDADLKAVDVRKKQNELLANVAGTITDQASLVRGVGMLLGQGVLDQKQALEWLQKPWNEQTAAEVKQIAGMATSEKDRAEMLMKQAEEARKEEEHKATIGGKRVNDQGLNPYQQAQIEQGNKTTDQRNFEAARGNPQFEAWLNTKRPVTNISTNVNMPQQTFRNERDLRTEFSDRQEVKAYRVVSDQFARAKAAMNEAKGTGSLNAADQVLITVLNKILDPASVVRESEYARSALGQGWQSKFEGFIDKIQRGGAGISDSERGSVFNMIEKLNNASASQYSKVAEQYKGLAQGYQLNPQRVVDAAPSAAPEPAGAVPRVGGTFNGQKVLKVERVE